VNRFVPLAAIAICGLALAPRGIAGTIHAVHVSLAHPQVGGSGATAEEGCPSGMFPDNGACVHIEPEDESDAPVAQNAHREKSGKWVLYDQIPRRPDRPEDYEAYVFPIAGALPGGKHVISGYDLDHPDEMQRRGRTLKAVGHGGLDIPQARGTQVPLIALDHQQGDADVVYTGPLFGNTVVTRHTLREGGGLREYLLLFGHLDAIAPGLVKGGTLRVGDVVGTVGDTGSPELIHLHLEARRVREGVDVMSVGFPNQLLAAEISVVCDPRNVLPLRW
jgi:murein DD-endopeptidase MepM/ murein hydrolase activator NlpD